jgi:hypothetical protein
MNFGKFDAIMLLTMSLAVISMSFVFPAIGLTSSGSVTENQIPEFNVETDRFDIAGEFPDPPRSGTTGNLEFDSSKQAALSNNRIWLEGGTSGGYEMFLSEETSNNSSVAEVRINEWDSGNVTANDSITLNSSGDIQGLVVGEYGVSLTAETVSPPIYEVSYEVTSRPDDSEGLVGSIFNVGSATAQTLYWFGQILFWALTSIVEVTINAINGLAGVTSYLLGLVSFLTVTYTSIVTGSAGFASVFVAIPGIVLSIILGKIVVIGITLLPTT